MKSIPGIPEDILTMIDEARNAILDRLPYEPHLIVLYGSQARGDATPESDVDLLVVVDRYDPAVVDLARDAVYDVMWNHDFAPLISVNVMPRHEYEEQRRKGYSFVRSVQREGIVLWQAA